MSQSPIQKPQPGDRSTERYFNNWGTLGGMIRQGASFSGRERNRCFLNTKGERFVDVSFVTGLDQLDDGRGIASVDWDQDGDLDIWLANRTGPRVRMLRNDSPRTQNFVAFRLVGRQCNRDAIGARVEVSLAETQDRQLPNLRMKTLRAGEGFLSQSSKVIHFGLGASTDIAAVKVFWPGQLKPQIFRNIAVNERYQLVQGVNDAQPIRTKRRLRQSPPKIVATNQKDEVGSRTILTRRLRMPTVHYRDIKSLNENSDTMKGPLLVSIWGSWCKPCVSELSMLTLHEPEIRAKGLRILALSVDEVDTTAQSNATLVRHTLDEIGFPFEAGMASDESMRILTELTHQIFYPMNPLSLPCSFLVDADGMLAAFYRGPVNLETVLADIELLTASREAVVEAAFPFPGRHLIARPEPTRLAIARSYFEGEYLDLARKNVLQFLEEVSNPDTFEALTQQMAVASDSRIRTVSDALKSEQLRLQTRALQLLVNIDRRSRSTSKLERSLVRLLGLTPENDRARSELIVLAMKNGNSTLANRELSKLKDRAGKLLSAQLALGQAFMQQGQLAEAMRVFKSAADSYPTNMEAQFNLAAASQVVGDESLAVQQYEKILKTTPNHLDARNNLAWLHATAKDPHRDPRKAIRLAESLCAASAHQNPSHLDTLATAFASAGEFDKAAAVAANAHRLARGQGETALANALEKRVQEYRGRRSVSGSDILPSQDRS